MTFHRVILRPYQLKILNALEKDNYKYIVPILPRRAGKDFLAIQIAFRQAIKKPCSIYYIYPTQEQARKAIWNGISRDGVRLMDYFSDEICRKNNSEMRVTFRHNGSTVQFAGSDYYDRLRGINAHGVIFSEYAYQSPMALDVISPVLTGSDGWAIFISTPSGHNHFWDLYQDALKKPDYWFTMNLTVEDTGHMSPERLAHEKERMSRERFLQEYYSSFDCGQEGAIFAAYIQDMREEKRIGRVLYDPSLPVFTAWDIGIRDSTSIVFFQLSGTSIHIIDYYENRNEGAEHYVRLIKAKPYIYDTHLFPHDIMVREFGTGLTRIEQLENFGIHGVRVPKVSVLSKIEASRVTLRKTFIDETNCKHLIRALDSHQFEYNEKREMFNDKNPYHDWTSHAVDAFAYLSIGLNLIENPKAQQDIDEAELYGVSSLGPRSYGSLNR